MYLSGVAKLFSLYLIMNLNRLLLFIATNLCVMAFFYMLCLFSYGVQAICWETFSRLFTTDTAL